MTAAEKEHRFAEIYRDNRMRLIRFCRGFLGGDGDADDLFQEIMLQVWRGLDGFEHRSQASTWLYRIAVNSALLYRHRLRRRGTPGPADEELPAQSPSPLARAEWSEQLDALLRAIATLPPPDRLLAALLLEGFTYKEMAEILGISTNHAGVRVSRLRQKLEKAIRGKET
ncbi:MAG: sigma-70 family RNA polymerase sigma factor [Bryobacteraceae bacterium]|nr:sigma-70 family RNA polymerase sigma factor [Bryobacteraceae bacterium]